MGMRNRRQRSRGAQPWPCSKCKAPLWPQIADATAARTGLKPREMIHVCGRCKTMHLLTAEGNLRPLTAAERFRAEMEFAPQLKLVRAIDMEASPTPHAYCIPTPPVRLGDPPPMTFDAPADYTADQRARVEDELERFRAAQREGSVAHQVPDAALDSPHLREAWHAGAWLEAHLLDAGCDRITARQICFENGRLCALAADPWIPTRRTLDVYRTAHPHSCAQQPADVPPACIDPGGPPQG